MPKLRNILLKESFWKRPIEPKRTAGSGMKPPRMRGGPKATGSDSAR